jgi:hypothetical protein
MEAGQEHSSAFLRYEYRSDPMGIHRYKVVGNGHGGERKIHACEPGKCGNYPPEVLMLTEQELAQIIARNEP